MDGFIECEFKFTVNPNLDLSNPMDAGGGGTTRVRWWRGSSASRWRHDSRTADACDVGAAEPAAAAAAARGGGEEEAGSEEWDDDGRWCVEFAARGCRAVNSRQRTDDDSCRAKNGADNSTSSAVSARTTDTTPLAAGAEKTALTDLTL